MYLGNFLVLMSFLMGVLSQYPAHGGYRGFQKQIVPIVSQDFQISPDNRAYRFSYASADGSQRHESGTQKSPQGYSVTGSFSYTLPNVDSRSVVRELLVHFHNDHEQHIDYPLKMFTAEKVKETFGKGAPVQVNYVSDEFGYQPSGSGIHPDIIKAVAEQVAEARTSPQSSYGGIPYSAHRPVYG